MARLKDQKQRKLSSRTWLERQLNDPYVTRAKRDGYRSRAAYKLLEIEERYRFLRPGQKILDLGAAPGGWSQVAAKAVGSSQNKVQVFGIDLLPIEAVPGVEFRVLDFLDAEAPQILKDWL